MPSESINFTPHWAIMTDEGRTHFDTPSEAIMEHVDNSITACAQNTADEGRRIEVLVLAPFHEEESDDPAYLVIFDNAGGMDKEDLEAYFTCSLGREMRDLAPTPQSSSSSTARQPGGSLTYELSKFGVGAVQSFAYLGSKLTVVTKARRDGERVVRSFGIDHDSFKQKEKQGSRADAYKGVVEKAKSALHFLDDRLKRYNYLVDHMEESAKLGHFTYVIITLNDLTKEKLVLDRCHSLKRDLGDVYYYYLRPEDLPNLDSGRGASGAVPLGPGSAQKKQKGRSGQALSRGASSSDADSHDASRVDITVTYVKGAGPNAKVWSTDLREDLPQTLEGRYLRDAQGEPFIASFETDDPDTKPRKDGSVVQAQRRFHATMVCYYYPYRGYRESRPVPYKVRRLDGDSSDSDDDMETGDTDGIISVRWQTRRLPKARYQRLVFFPSDRSKDRTKESEFGHWKARIHVTLFISDWYFPVSNNKLTVRGDFAQILSDAKRLLLTRDLQVNFLSWLKKNHEEYDRESTFEDPIPRPIQATRKDAEWFRTLRYGRSDHQKWVMGEAVELTIVSGGSSQGKKRGRGGAATASAAVKKTTEKHYGVICFFEKTEQEQRVYYAREPREVFHHACKSVPIALLDPVQGKMNSDKWIEVGNSLKRCIPKALEICKWDGSSRIHRGPLGALEDGVERESLPCRSLLVGMRDYNDALITEVSTPLPKLFIVRMQILDRLNNSTVLNVWTAESVLDPEHCRYYPFTIPKELKLSKGRYWLLFHAMQTNVPRGNDTCTEEIGVKKALAFDVNPAPAGPPDEIDVEGLEQLRFVISEEVPLPAFTIRLRDKNKRPTHCEHLTVEFSLLGIPGWDFEYRGRNKKGSSSKKRSRGGDAPVFSISEEDASDGLSFSKGDFVAILLLGKEPMLSGDKPQVVTKQCTLVVTCGEKESKEFACDRAVMVEPGRPVRLQLASREKLTAKPIDNKSELPDLVIRTLDCGDNVTAPSPSETWSVSILRPDGVQLVPTGQPLPQEVDAKGQVSLRGVQVHADFLREDAGRLAGGKLVTLEMRVVVPQRSGGLAQPLTMEIPFTVGPRKGVPVQAFLELRERPGGAARTADVSLKIPGYANDDDAKNAKLKYTVDAGTVFNYAHMRVLDEVGDIVGDARVDAEMTVSWDKGSFRKMEHGLPPLTGPTSMFHSFSCTAGVTFKSQYLGQKFRFAFEIKAQPTAIAQVWFHHDWSLKVQSGVPFSRSTAAICYRDLHKNPVKANAKTSVPWVEFVGEQITVHPSAKLAAVLDPGSGNFYIPHPITIIGQPQRLKVKAGASQMTPVKYEIVLEAGPASEIVVGLLQEDRQDGERSGSAGGACNRQLTLRLCQGEPVGNLKVDLFDSGFTNRATVASEGCRIVLFIDAKRGPETLLASLDVEAGSTGPYVLPSFRYPDSGDRTLIVQLRKGSTVVCKGEVKCENYKINRVIGLKPLFLETESRAWFKRDAKDELQLEGRFSDAQRAMTSFTVDSKPPAVVVRLEMEDGADVPLASLPAASMQVAVMKDGERNTLLGWYADKWEVCREENGGGLLAVWMPVADAAIPTPGTYRVKASYYEHRENIKALTDVEKLQREVVKDVMVRPGVAVALKPQAELRSRHAASNRPDDKEGRKVMEGPTFVPVDRTNSPTVHDEYAVVKIQRERDAAQAATSDQQGQDVESGEGGAELPRLADADAHGCVAGTKVSNMKGLTEYRFRSLFVDKNSGRTAGTYSLCFRAPGLKPYYHSFVFVTDDTRRAAMEKYQEQLGPLREAHNQHNNSILLLSRQISAFSPQYRSLVVSMASCYSEVQLKSREFRQSEMLNLSSYLEAKQQEASQARSARKPHGYPPPGIGQVQSYGLVVDLGYVKDKDLALLLSWYANKKSMKAVVVPANRDYDKLKVTVPSVPVYSEEDMTEFKQGQPRNLGDAALPLDHVAATGFLNYAVNAIQLKPDDERFRSNVFWDIFGTCMIFDTEANAMAYRAQHKGKRSTLLTVKEGRRILNKGPLDAQDVMRDDDARNLSFVFGELPATETAEYRETDKLYTKLRALDKLLSDRERLEGEEEKLLRDPVAAQRVQEINIIEERLRELMKPSRG